MALACDHKELAKAIITFIKTGEYTGAEFNAFEFIEALPFLKHITSNFSKGNSALPSGCVYCNANWFWCASNEKNRKALIALLKQLNSFDYGDAVYRIIIQRGEQKDFFGVMQPVNRGTLHRYDSDVLNSFFATFQIPPDSFYTNVDCHYKLHYCCSKHLEFQDFVTWYWAEKITGMSLSFPESRLVNSFVYGDIKELEEIYMTKDYKKTVKDAKKAVEEQRKNRHILAEKVIEYEKDQYWAGRGFDYDRAKEKIEALYEAPDGWSSKQSKELLEKAKPFFEEIGDFGELPF